MDNLQASLRSIGHVSARCRRTVHVAMLSIMFCYLNWIEIETFWTETKDNFISNSCYKYMLLWPFIFLLRYTEEFCSPFPPLISLSFIVFFSLSRFLRLLFSSLFSFLPTQKIVWIRIIRRLSTARNRLSVALVVIATTVSWTVQQLYVRY